MDLSDQWHEFAAQLDEQNAVEREQDELRATVIKSMAKAATALEAYHHHQRKHGQHAVIPVQSMDDLMFWQQIVLSYH